MAGWIRRIYLRFGAPVVLVGISFMTALLMFGFLYDTMATDTYEVELFQLSEETIRAAKTVEDPVRTELERTRAAAEVQPSYRYIEEIADNQAAVVDSLFGYVLEAKRATEAGGEDEPDPRDAVGALASLRESIRLLEQNENGLRLTDDMLLSLLALENDVLLRVEREVRNQVLAVLQDPLRETGLTQARNSAEQEIRRDDQVPASAIPVAVAIARANIVPNELINEELTEQQSEQAQASVEPTRILQGQVLIQEGQLIDREVYRQLELAGMTEQPSNYRPVLALGLFVLITAGLLLLVLQSAKVEGVKKAIRLTIVFFVFALSLVIMKLLEIISGNFGVVVDFIYPTALAGILVRLLIDERTAVYVTILLSACAGMMLQSGYAGVFQMDSALYVLFGGLTGIYLIRNGHRSIRILPISLAVGGVHLLYIAFYLLLNQSQYTVEEIAFYVAAALAAGLLSGTLATGLLPLFETAFGILSTMKLLELSNPNHPLLKKILTETPGTYHHSVMVANLSDAACEAVGANGLLARVGCYYHDIGKTINPQYFIENQSHGNPHDYLTPQQSRDIILAHGKDGAAILRKQKMPKELIDIAEQHHGTTLLKFFYYKAKEKNEELPEQEYRYTGPKPQSREIAIIMIADSLEAAVRSMESPSTEKIRKMVDSITEDKLKDGQFDECDITLKELKRVKSVMCETLNGIFHSRIAYPDDKK
ncbi:HDIG domain-containing protein [Planococcus sp. CP5-4]|uniref:HD family phosphohydrolase n=1 Tax=unclassified Planococcus (in: firmicutes) TaxID=2662419 RepID=UPI001C21C7B2|nr:MULTISPECIES: HDIG domain-containing metalloprotein [unclassified Planococcus (in: firmicutes)]MBU9672815.1 HDIG domain-containing protein [Planococcus sp. CP5-4_YE]MBV0908587.1 HDIG domain-containing protein [Planococcus sp. CP5-4_UN]MBW6063356.1 HDIG domain-containing protein [Planococcus sp. CP5-4]